MKRLPFSYVSPVLLFILLLITGCDESSPRETKSGQNVAPSSSRTNEETSTLKLPDFRKAADAQKKTDNTENETARTEKNEPLNKSMRKESKGSLPLEKSNQGSSPRETPRNDSSSSSEKNPSGNTAGAQSECNTKSHNGKSKQTIPAGWTSTEIKNPPSPENLEIWNNIIASLEELIVARKVKFSSLGANNTFLSDLSGGKYRAVGRCIVTEKSGNQIAYEFECVARVNKYEASILSAKFHTQDN